MSEPLAPIEPARITPQPAPAAPASGEAPPHGDVSFQALLTDSLREVEKRIDTANALTRSFAVDDSVPVHEVTIALEEARLAVDLALQIRNRLVEAYRDMMNTQL